MLVNTPGQTAAPIPGLNGNRWPLSSLFNNIPNALPGQAPPVYPLPAGPNQALNDYLMAQVQNLPGSMQGENGLLQMAMTRKALLASQLPLLKGVQSLLQSLPSRKQMRAFSPGFSGPFQVGYGNVPVPAGSPNWYGAKAGAGISRYAGTDQGVDFTSTGAIPAFDKAVVTGIGPETDIEGQHGSYVIYKLLAGPNKGKYVYTAENFAPTVRVGERLRPGQTVGINRGVTPGGTGIEIGFNQSPNSWYPTAPLGRGAAAHGATSAGEQMWNYIQAIERALAARSRR